MWMLAAAANEEWDGDESFLLVVSLIITVFGAVAWARWLGWARGPRREVPWIGTLILGLVASLAMLVAVTWFWTAVEIRHGRDYMWLVLAMGTAWLSLCHLFFRWAGVGVGEDACERRNPAAACAIAGGTFGAMLIFCGANTGEGPSFWNNVFSALLGGTGWFGMWFALEAMAKASRTVTEDRDLAAGIRLAGFLVAQGLILGRAVAGNWNSLEGTIADFGRDGWPALILMLIAAALEKPLRPTPQKPSPSPISHGVPAALLYLALAGAWVVKLGWWEGLPR